MRLLSIAILLLSSSTYASSNAYDLKLDLSYDGKHVSSPRLILNEGEMATLTQKRDGEEQFIEVVATEGATKGHPGIFMDFTIGVLHQNGNRTILSRPQVLVKEHELTNFTLGPENGIKERFSLSVRAKRRPLNESKTN